MEQCRPLYVPSDPGNQTDLFRAVSPAPLLGLVAGLNKCVHGHSGLHPLRMPLEIQNPQRGSRLPEVCSSSGDARLVPRGLVSITSKTYRED